MEEKRHYKLYKSGKNWVVASIAAITVLSGSGLASTALNVHAATPVVAAQSNINFSALKAQLVWSNAKADNASIYSTSAGMKLVAQLKADIATANGYIANPKSTTQAKVTAITTALKNDGVALNNEVANILNGQLFWSNKKVASDYVTTQGKALFAQLQTQLATANSYVKNPSLATPANVMAITSALHQTGLDLYASKVTDLKAQLVWSNAKKAADYTTEAGKKAFATLTADIATANGYVAAPEFATPAEIATITDKLHQDGLDLIASNKVADTTTLQFLISQAPTTNFKADGVSHIYTASSYAAFLSVLANANKVLNDKNASQADVDAATTALTTALGQALPAQATAQTGLQKVTSANGLDFSALDANVLTATGLNNQVNAASMYTQASWDAFQTAFTAANVADALSIASGVNSFAHTATTQSAIDTANSNLQSAINGLVAVSAGKADTSLLANEVSAIKAGSTKATLTNTPVNNMIFDAVSFSAFQTAYNAAVATLANADATQGQIDIALANLKAAVTGLNKISATAVDYSQINADIKAAQKLVAFSGTGITGTTAINQNNGGNNVYTAASYTALTAALANATAATGSAAATQVATLDAALTKAIAGLTLAPAGQLDTSAATKTINQATTIIAGGNVNAKGAAIYSTTTFVALQTALATVNADLTNAKTTQATFDKDVAALATALNTNLKIATATSDDAQLKADLAAYVTTGASNQYKGAIDVAGAVVTAATTTTPAFATVTIAGNSVVITGASWTTLTNAIAAVNALYKDKTIASGLLTTTTQAQINAADANLLAAVKGLQYTNASAAITALKTQINTANSLSSSNYSTTTWDALQADLKLANGALNGSAQDGTKGTADTTTVYGLAQQLNNDIAALVAPTNTPAAAVALTDAQVTQVTTDGTTVSANNLVDGSIKYTVASFNQLVAAYNAVTNLFPAGTTTFTTTTAVNSGVTQAQLTAALANLTTAENNLVTIAQVSPAKPANGWTDSSVLKADLAKATAIKAADYSATSFNALQQAITAANAVNLATAAQADINAADTALTKAMNQLVSQNKSALGTIFFNAPTLNDAKYTGAKAWIQVEYKAAYNNAQAVLNNASATSTDISGAISQLQQALSDLNGSN